VDGGSTMIPRPWQRPLPIRPDRAAGRAAQRMPGGGGHRDLLLFLPPNDRPHAPDLIRAALADGTHGWGRFDGGSRGTSVAGDWRLMISSRLTGIARATRRFSARRPLHRGWMLSDYRLMEDIALSKALNISRRPPVLRACQTSGRRWEKHGALRHPADVAAAARLRLGRTLTSLRSLWLPERPRQPACRFARAPSRPAKTRLIPRLGAKGGALQAALVRHALENSGLAGLGPVPVVRPDRSSVFQICARDSIFTCMRSLTAISVAYARRLRGGYARTLLLVGSDAPRSRRAT